MIYSKSMQFLFVLFVSTGLYAQTSDSSQTTPASNDRPASVSYMDDKQLAKSVRAALRQGKRLGYNLSNVRVRSNGGVVTLTGAVPAQSDVIGATSVTQAVPGVASVDNRLIVRVPLNRYGGQ